MNILKVMQRVEEKQLHQNFKSHQKIKKLLKNNSANELKTKQKTEEDRRDDHRYTDHREINDRFTPCYTEEWCQQERWNLLSETLYKSNKHIQVTLTNTATCRPCTARSDGPSNRNRNCHGSRIKCSKGYSYFQSEYLISYPFEK